MVITVSPIVPFLVKTSAFAEASLPLAKSRPWIGTVPSCWTASYGGSESLSFKRSPRDKTSCMFENDNARGLRNTRGCLTRVAIQDDHHGNRNDQVPILRINGIIEKDSESLKKPGTWNPFDESAAPAHQKIDHLSETREIPGDAFQLR